MTLSTSYDDLHDLAAGSPELVDHDSGATTGIRLVRLIDTGGMATVFHAKRGEGPIPRTLSPQTPQELAIKVVQPAMLAQLSALGCDAYELFRKECVVYERLSSRTPPTPFAVGFYGCGLSDVECPGGVRRLPWLALEYVDTDAAGTSLLERVARAHEGVDPIRAHRLVRRIVSGLEALHELDVVHRDLKPENILVAGPVDDEIPKITDYGIARVDGLATGLAAATQAYAGFEQLLGIQGMRNPLIGAWTDVHALGALVWFIIGGEQWLATWDVWRAGERRPLRSAQRLHPGFAGAGALLSELDSVLAKAAAPKISAVLADASPEASAIYELLCRRYPAVRAGHERYQDVATFAGALLPVLERIAAQWTARASRENRRATEYRPTVLMSPGGPQGEPYKVRDSPSKPARHADGKQATMHLRPGCVAFQADGRVLVQSGLHLYFYIDDRPYPVASPDPKAAPQHAGLLAATRSVVYLGELGYGLVGPGHVMLARRGQWITMPLPSRPAGQVGPIEACLGEQGRLLIATAETDDGDGGSDLWETTDGMTWVGPTVIPLGGEGHALATGPYGTLLVGSKGGRRARAAFLRPDGALRVYSDPITKLMPLRLAVCGNERDAWAASDAAVVRLGMTSGTIEIDDLESPPVHMALDLVGIPWLVTERAVRRREPGEAESSWRVIHQRGPERPKLCAIGFTPRGARVLDEEGGSVHIVPGDVERWQKPAGLP